MRTYIQEETGIKINTMPFPQFEENMNKEENLQKLGFGFVCRETENVRCEDLILQINDLINQGVTHVKFDLSPGYVHVEAFKEINPNQQKLDFNAE